MNLGKSQPSCFDNYSKGEKVVIFSASLKVTKSIISNTKFSLQTIQLIKSCISLNEKKYRWKQNGDIIGNSLTNGFTIGIICVRKSLKVFFWMFATFSGRYLFKIPFLAGILIFSTLHLGLTSMRATASYLYERLVAAACYSIVYQPFRVQGALTK